MPCYTDTMEFILLGALLGVFVIMAMGQSRRRRAVSDQQSAMIDRLRPGMRVKTVAGLIGRIKEIREENAALKTVLLETGTGTMVGYQLVDINAIMMVMDEAMTNNVKEFDNAAETPATPAKTTFEEMKAASDGIKPEAGEPSISATPDFDAAAFVEKSNTKRKTPAKK